MNLIDNVVSFFSPKSGMERAKYRSAEKILKKSMRNYEAATKGRRSAKFQNTGSGSANLDITRDLPLLRDRSTHAYKNNPSAFKAIRTIQNNVIGTGIMPTPVGKNTKLTSKEIKIIKDEWKSFAETSICDFDDSLTYYGLQSLAMRTIAMKGEVFIYRQRDSSQRVPIKLQVLSPHMVDNSKSSYISTRTSGNYIVQGVEFDSRGRKVGYHIFDHNPNNDVSMKLSSKFVSIDDILHVFYKEYPEQVRGVPFGVASMLSMSDLDDYKDAQLMLQKISACHVAFTTKPIDAAELGNVDEEGHIIDRMEPGMIEYLSPGEQVTFNNPPVANGFKDYVSKNEQSNAAGFGITYEQMTGDLGNVNFSSGRMGWIEAQRQIEDWQYNMFIPQFCVKTFQWFIEGLQIRNLITKDVVAEWTPQGREMIDPVKEMNGLILELKSGLVSWDEACKRRGYNPDTLFEQIKLDKQRFSDAGIEVDWIIDNKIESPTMPNGEEKLNPEDLKRVLDAYSVGVRAGTITPTDNDEKYFRDLAKFPEMSEAVISAWKEDNGFRRPITLAVAKDNSDFQA
jgi:lambda family phage portal protein